MTRGPKPNLERSSVIVGLYKNGLLQSEIAEIYQVSRARIQQILAAAGVNLKDSGLFISRHESRKERQKEILKIKNQYCIETYGVGVEQLSKYEKKTKKLYYMQKTNASRRGIEFHLTIKEWSDIWVSSGHLSKRGIRKDEFVMGRIGDSGPYALGNVYICSASQNIKDGYIARGFDPIKK